MKAVVLSSGGIDSTTCLAIAINTYGKENVVTLSMWYGQRHDKELECAREIAKYYGVDHYELDLSKIFEKSNCSLLKQSTEEIAHGSYAEQQKGCEGPVATYVPFRNGLFLSAAASFALSLFPNEQTKIYCGMHADDAAGNAYPDCSVDFVYSMSQAIWEGTGRMVDITAPLVSKNKSEVVKTGLGLKTPYHLTWSCYEGKDKACGKCGTCIDRLKAFADNGVEDPIKYE